MSQNTLKPLPSTLREKKRYLVFEVLSRKKIVPLAKAAKAIAFSFASMHGEKGAANAGLLFLARKSNDDKQRGMMRVNRKYVEDLKSSLTLVKDIEGEESAIRSIGTSGMIKKAEEKFIAS